MTAISTRLATITVAIAGAALLAATLTATTADARKISGGGIKGATVKAGGFAGKTTSIFKPQFNPVGPTRPLNPPLGPVKSIPAAPFKPTKPPVVCIKAPCFPQHPHQGQHPGQHHGRTVLLGGATIVGAAVATCGHAYRMMKHTGLPYWYHRYQRCIGAE